MKSEQLFDEQATKYSDFAKPWVFDHYCDKKAAYLSKTNSTLVLDVGCGTGVLLNKVGKGIGIDSSLGMLKEAKKEGNVFIHASVSDLPFKDNTFDLVYSANTFHHLAVEGSTFVKESLKEMIRVCKKEGFISILDPNPRNPYWWFFLSNNKFDTGKEKLVSVKFLIKLLKNNTNDIKIEYSGFIPGSCPRFLFNFVKKIETLIEKTILSKILCSHYFIKAKKNENFIS